MKFIFFDKSEEILQIKNYFENYDNIFVEQIDAKDLFTLSVKPDIVISPANSFGFMDGGIDYVYSRVLFPNVEKNVKLAIKNIGIQTMIKRYYLPIGSAIIVPTENNIIPKMMVVPTMIFPGDIKRTDNVYWCMSAILRLLDNINEDLNVYIPGLGTGYGNITIDDFGKDVLRAFENPAEYFNKNIILNDINYFVLDKCACIQPDWYSNREVNEKERKN